MSYNSSLYTITSNVQTSMSMYSMYIYSQRVSVYFLYNIPFFFCVVQPPVIQIGPKNQTILVNNTVTLDCLATGYGNIGYQWIKSSMGVTDITDSYLVIEDTDGDGAGEYSCVATNVGGLTTSAPAFVRVLKPG